MRGFRSLFILVGLTTQPALGESELSIQGRSFAEGRNGRANIALRYRKEAHEFSGVSDAFRGAGLFYHYWFFGAVGKNVWRPHANIGAGYWANGLELAPGIGVHMRLGNVALRFDNYIYLRHDGLVDKDTITIAASLFF